MKFIFNQQVRIIKGFYVGQIGKCRAHTLVKPTPPADPNEIAGPSTHGYEVLLNDFDGISVWMKEEDLEDAPAAN